MLKNNEGIEIELISFEDEIEKTLNDCDEIIIVKESNVKIEVFFIKKIINFGQLIKYKTKRTNIINCKNKLHKFFNKINIVESQQTRNLYKKLREDYKSFVRKKTLVCFF